MDADQSTLSNTNSAPSTEGRPGSDSLVDLYAGAVGQLKNDFCTRHLLNSLILRDALENLLRQSEIRDPLFVNKILRVDEGLCALAPRAYCLRKEIVELRRGLRPSQDAWWWYLDRILPARLKWFERVVLFLSLALFPLSLGFAIELARRYGGDGGGVGLESLLPIVATILASFSVGSVVSLSFRDRLTALLEMVGCGLRWRPLVSCLILALLSTIFGLWAASPRISAFYNDQGVSKLDGQRGPHIQLSEARSVLERAVRFDPTNSVAHYNLGRVYADLLEEDRAVTEYLIAFNAGLDLAGNNLGHLYLRRGDYDRAAFVLQRSSALSEPHGKKTDPELRYKELKNLGWARWGQQRFDEARVLLEEAVRLEPNRAEAHCLLARTLAAQREPNAANQWRSCLGLAWQDFGEPTQDIWVGEARAFLDGTTNGRSQ